MDSVSIIFTEIVDQTSLGCSPLEQGRQYYSDAGERSNKTLVWW